ncbi:MAG: Hsp20/alpha crystallin family protein [bacterium]
MAKEKRSFFEKLTGAVHVEDDLEPATPRKVTTHGSEGRSGATKSDEWAEENAEGQLPVDVYQTPTDIFIKTLIPGTKVDDLDISITRDMVTIKGKRDASREIAEDDYFFRELYWGSFSRTILLPQEIDVEGAEAGEKLGLLTIRLPKIDKSRQTKLKVKSGN